MNKVKSKLGCKNIIYLDFCDISLFSCTNMYTSNKKAQIAAVYKTVLLAIQPNLDTRIPIKAVANVSPKMYWKNPMNPVDDPTANFGTASLTIRPTKVNGA